MRDGQHQKLGPDGQPVARQRSGRGGGWEYHLSLLPAPARVELATRQAVVAPDLPEVNEQGLARAAGLDARRRVRAEARAAVFARYRPGRFRARRGRCG